MPICLNQTFIKEAQHLTADYLRQNRKLILACDMDETLLSETQDEQHIVMRPKVLYMLRNLRFLYELCLITYSTRDRAQQILRMRLDPKKKLFHGRVLCREDIIASFTNKQEALFAHLPQEKQKTRIPKLRVGTRSALLRPPAWPYVVILDDFPAAWSNFVTCIPIRPFLTGPNNTIINGKPLPKLLSGECGYMLSVLRFLCKVHCAVFPRNLVNMHLTLSGTPESTSQINKDKTTLIKKKPNSSSHGRTGCNTTAFSVMLALKRRINSNQRYQNLCYLDPGHLLNLDPKPVSISQPRPQAFFSRGLPIETRAI